MNDMGAPSGTPAFSGAVVAFRLPDGDEALPSAAVRPVMRVIFRRAANDQEFARTGTAFLVRAWSRVLVCCAHVLRTDADETPVSLVLDGLHDDDSPFVVRAVSYAYPKDFVDNDLAVIRLAGGLTNADPFETAVAPDAGPLTVVGYSDAGEVERIDVNATYIPPWIRYPGAPTSGGMSGGPVFDAANRVVGVHTGRVRLDGAQVEAGFQFDGDVLTECMKRSFEILGDA